MLYLNAYKVYQAYGGPEEGGWYYSVGEPMASLPIASIVKKGKSFINSEKSGITIVDCQDCKGAGKYECEDEESNTVFMKDCEYCSEIPADCALLNVLISTLSASLAYDIGRGESLEIRIEDCFAAAFPDVRPHYE